MEKYCTLVCISDTHGLHNSIIEKIPDGDFLIHAGDITNHGELYQLKSFNEWLGNLPHRHKIVIAGNHDFCFENLRKEEARKCLTNCHYLENDQLTIEGLKFYGSPIQPWFFNWAFNKERGEDIRRYWDEIPDDTNVLITHGPVYNLLDTVPDGSKVGCKDLKKRIKDLKFLKAHIGGHIHCSAGIKKVKKVQYVNAAICDERYSPCQPPRVIKIKI